MDATKGWSLDDEYHTYSKCIDFNMFRIDKRPSGKWMLSTGVTHIATRPTLRECQILAHQTARLWAGDTK